MSLPRVWLFADDAWPVEHVVEAARVASSAVPIAVVARAKDPARRAALVAALVGDPSPSRVVFVSSCDARDLVPGVEGLHLGGVDALDGSARRAAVSAARSALPEGAWLSVPTHGAPEPASAAQADALVASPIFASPGKGAARGIGALLEARAAAPAARIVALGGITGVDEARAAASAGADAVGVVRALLGADRPDEISRALAAVFEP